MSLLNKCLNLLVYAVPIQLILLQKICCRAGLTEYVVDTDPAHLCGLLLGKKLGNCTAETADHGSFLHGDDLSCLRSAAEDQLLIERLTQRPVATIVTSVPSLRRTPFPISNL